MWTLDTYIEVTPAAVDALKDRTRQKSGRGYKPTRSGRRAVRPLQEARDAILAATVAETTCADSNL